MKVQSQPMIVVKNVPASTAWYRRILGLQSGHGGDKYEILISDDKMVMQIHAAGEEDHHGYLRDIQQPTGEGILLWFGVDEFEKAVEAALEIGARVHRDAYFNELGRQKEIWLRDPDGFLVVISGPSEYPLRVVED